MKIIRQFNTFILVIAIALLVLVTFVYLLEERLTPTFERVLYGGIILLMYYLIVNALTIVRSLRRKVVRETISVLFLVPVVFGILALVYLIGDEYKMRFDLSVGEKFSLSAQTINILEGLDNDITILCFFKDTQPGREILKTSLDQYQYHSSKIKYEFVDPDKYPQRAREHGVENYGEVVVVSDKGREKMKEVSTEETLTNAILKVISEDKKVLYFVTGHGEPVLDNMELQGYGLLKRHLTLENYEVKKLSLIRTTSIPKDASCVILAAPKTDLFEEEMVVLSKYVVEEGGALFILADIEAPVTLQTFLTDWGITLGNDIVIDKMSQLFGASYETAVIGQYGEHAITKNFNVACFFPTTTSVTLQSNLPHDFEGLYLAYSGPGSWAETNMALLEAEGKASLDKDDIAGPVSVGVVLTKEVEIKEISPEEDKEEMGWDQGVDEPVRQTKNKTAKVVVTGDSDFVSNAHLRLSGNKDLFLNIVAWLCGDETLIAIRPKQIDATPLYLRTGQSRMLFFVTVIGMPLVFLVIGVFVFVRRKRGK